MRQFVESHSTTCILRNGTTSTSLLLINSFYCPVLHCIVLYCAVLYCTILHCTMLHCTVLVLSLLLIGFYLSVRADVVRSKHMDEWTVDQLSAWMCTLHMQEHVHTLFSQGWEILFLFCVFLSIFIDAKIQNAKYLKQNISRRGEQYICDSGRVINVEKGKRNDHYYE